MSKVVNISKAKKGKKTEGFFLGLIFMVAVLCFLLLSPVFQIKKIQVEGVLRLSANSIVEHSELHYGENIFRIDKEEVIKNEFEEEGYSVTTSRNKNNSKVIILATGNKKNTPNIKGIKEFEGKGISYCAICDGFFYKDKNVVVIGSGNYAISETNDLVNISKQITILTNGNKAPEIRADNVKTNEKEIKEIRGDSRVEEIEFTDNTTLKTDGIFIAEGTAGSLEFEKKLGIITKNNKIIVNEKMETNIPGIYACGDCTEGLLQISKAVYQGTVAGLETIKYLKDKN